MLFVGALPLFSVRISRRAAFGVVFSLISANVYREVVFMSFFFANILPFSFATGCT